MQNRISLTSSPYLPLHRSFLCHVTFDHDGYLPTGLHSYDAQSQGRPKRRFRKYCVSRMQDRLMDLVRVGRPATQTLRRSCRSWSWMFKAVDAGGASFAGVNF